MGFRDNYKKYGYTTIYSLLENNKNSEFSIYILSDNLDFQYFKSLESLFKCKIIPISVSSTEISKIDCGYLTFGTLIRLLIGKYIPNNIDTILYLDADLIINGDIRPLVNLELGDCYAAVVKSNVSKKHLKRINIESDDYFNAGVMLLNLNACRSDNVFERSLNLLHHNRLKFLDQDALNIVMNQNVKYIDQKWNFDSFRAKSLILNRSNDIINNEVLIYHFTGTDKPWNQLCQNQFKNVYRRFYCDQLNYNLVNNNSILNRLKYEIVIWLFKLPVSRWLIRLIRNSIRTTIS